MWLIPIPPKPWAPWRPFVPVLDTSFIFPAFWIACHHGDGWWGGKGAGSPDMNRTSPRRVLIGSSHGSGVPWHTGCTQRSHCQRNLPRFGWFFFLLLLLLLLNEGMNLNLNKNPLLSLFTGYFIYDFFDMLFNQKLSHSWELLFHHLVVGLTSISKYMLHCQSTMAGSVATQPNLTAE